MLRWLARYDAWCQEWGLVPENRRCCAPVRYDEDEQEEPTSEGDASPLNQNCASRPR
nr:fructose-bisphosphate aldolase [Aeromonas rivipollensis]